MVLELPVNKFYFEAIKEKQLIEDFRAIKKFWIFKLIKNKYLKQLKDSMGNINPMDIVKIYIQFEDDIFEDKYTKIIFKNGYKDNSPKIKTKIGKIRLTTPYEETCMGRGIAFAIEVIY